MMNILFITSYPIEYNTSANTRNQGLISGLLKNGYQVSTLSPYPTNTAFYSGKLIELPLKKRYWIGNTDVVSDSGQKKSKPGRIKIILESLYTSFAVYDRRSWLTRLIDGNSVDEDFDVIISSSDPKSAHLIAEKLIKVRPSVCKKWIQYWGDPFTGDITINSTFNSFLIKREEKRIIGKADKAVYVSPFTAEDICSCYPEYDKKIAFLPIPYIEEPNSNKDETKGDLISYLGNYTSTRRDVRPLIEAINEMKLPAAIVGDSDLRIEPNEHLIVKERMNHEELKQITEKTAVYVCVCNLHGTQIPGKVYHYVDTGKPILVILDGEYSGKMREFFESFQRFYLCDNNVTDIKKTLRIIIKEKKSFDVPDQLKPSFIAAEFIK